MNLFLQLFMLLREWKSKNYRMYGRRPCLQVRSWPKCACCGHHRVLRLGPNVACSALLGVQIQKNDRFVRICLRGHHSLRIPRLASHGQKCAVVPRCYEQLACAWRSLLRSRVLGRPGAQGLMTPRVRQDARESFRFVSDIVRWARLLESGVSRAENAERPA